ncbi:MAG TPA: hypothetical protein VLS89_11645 [Candidatus Nanopelagicales bacterium]|nr:hypothetical protein [Candidatus Nanopelagicales bacterium]
MYRALDRFPGLFVVACLLISGCGNVVVIDDDDPRAPGGKPAPEEPGEPGEVPVDPGPVEPSPEAIAYVGVETAGYPDGTGSYSTYGQFPIPAAEQLHDCTVDQIGSCKICVKNPKSTGSIYFGSAGPMTIETGSISFTVEPDVDDQMDVYRHSGWEVLWTTSQPISFWAPGDEAPGFEASFMTPDHATLTDPFWSAASQGMMPPLDRSQDLVVSWTSTGSEGALFLQVGGIILDEDTSPFLRCDFPQADGVGVVPAAALEKLAAGITTMAIGTYSRQVVLVSDWSVVVTAHGNVDTGDGYPTSIVEAELQ